jgi:rhamnosyltransferase
MPLVSVIIRTLNEERYLEELLSSIELQAKTDFDVEVVIIDSGSTDRTLEIARDFDARITHIDKSEFSFGRSLNLGCEFSKGEYLVFVSGHCVPVENSWLCSLVKPLLLNECQYTYGRQVGRDSTKFSERQLFEKYFPEESRVPQEGYFCNNANAAITREAWDRYQFDEELTGCEDMELAKRLVGDGGKLGYVSDAAVFHIHDESWQGVKRRYEREAIALQKIMPQMHLSLVDIVNFFIQAVIKDFRAALFRKVFLKEAVGIILFRYVQYLGAYNGNHITRQLSQKLKQKYFYPRWTDMDINDREEK